MSFRISTVLLIAALIWPYCPALAVETPPRNGGLKIYVLEGNGAVNNISARLTTPPLVEVRDQNDIPVAGAKVIFELPASGPGAVFEGGTQQYSTRADLRGQAVASAMVPNSQTGEFTIKVTASLDNRTGVALVKQVNSPTQFAERSIRKPFWTKRRLILIGVAAGTGIGLGVYFGTRSSSSNASSVLIPGTGSIGGPR